MALLLVLFVPEKNIRWFLGQNLHYISSFFFFILKGVSGPKRNPPARPIRSTTQIWIVTRHQYRISALAPQTSSGGETYGSVAKCRLFSQAKELCGVCAVSRSINRNKPFLVLVKAFGTGKWPIGSQYSVRHYRAKSHNGSW